MENLDINSVDTVENITQSDGYNSMLRNKEIDIINDLIKKQYIEFDSLGENIIRMYDSFITENSKYAIYKPMIDFVNDQYITIGDIDSLIPSPERTITAGDYIYEFICVDNVNALLPALIDKLGCSTIDDFDAIVNAQYCNDIGKFKKEYLSIIQLTIEQLLKLQDLHPAVKEDKKYQRLLAKYYYYQEIVDYGDCEQFLQNYIRPVLNSNFDTILWRIL